MKVNLIKDASGKVVASFENAAAGGPSLAPTLNAGDTIQVVDAADNYKSDIAGLYKQNSR